MQQWILKSSVARSSPKIRPPYKDPEHDIPLVFRKPSWQLRACFASVLVTPVLYRFYLIMVTIGYVLFSSIKPCQVFSCELSTLDNNYALLKATPKLYVSRVYTVSVLIIEPASVRTPSFITPIIILHVQNFFVFYFF